MKNQALLLISIFALAVFSACEKEESLKSNQTENVVDNSKTIIEKEKIPNEKANSQAINISTGLNGFSSYGAPGSADVKWKVKRQGASQFQNALVSTGNVETPGGAVSPMFNHPNCGIAARWITSDLTINNNISFNIPSGNAVYKRNFNLTCDHIYYAEIGIPKIMGDDEIVAIKINGNLINMPSPPIVYSPPTCGRYLNNPPIPITNFCQGGQNTISITVSTQNPGFSSLFIHASIAVQYKQGFCNGPADPEIGMGPG
ncbi:MAG: hypothetical protein RIC95_13880 [Vicingaceae bacterium]